MTGRQSAINTELIDSTAIIRFNLPAKRNALSIATLGELKSNLSELVAEPNLKAIIFTGTDDVFSSGANICELKQLNSESAKEFSRFGQGVFQMIAGAKQVTIAAVNGYCMGGALDLALSCDVRVCSKNAVFSHPGAGLGIITGWGGTQRLPRLIGTTRALEFFLTGRRVASAEAFEMGLVSRIADPVLNCALELAVDSSA